MHDWTGPNAVNRHVHCAACGKIFEILKAKGNCPGYSPCLICGHSFEQHSKGPVDAFYCRHCPCGNYIPEYATQGATD